MHTKVFRNRTVSVAATVVVIVMAMTGCHRNQIATGLVPGLGDLSDPIWQAQETNAEMSDFVVYDHEFTEDTEWLTTDGEDHVKQIAARLQEGIDAVVIIERTRLARREDTKYQYPVHPDPELDMRRRDVVALSLSAMGIADAEERVVVAPALVPGMRASEAESSYRSNIGRGGAFGSFGSFGGFFFGGGTRF